MKKLIYLIVAIAVLGLIVPGCIPVVPPAIQNESETLLNKNPAQLVGSYSYSWTTSIMNRTDFDFTVGMGWSGPYPWPPNVYYFFHSDQTPPGEYSGPIGGAWLFENIDFDITSEGQTFLVTLVADDPDFEGFANLLTNGTDEVIWFGYMGDRDNIASAGGQKGVQESLVFSGTDVGTDFPGWVIQSVSLTFNQIYLDPANVNKLVLDFTIDIYAGPPNQPPVVNSVAANPAQLWPPNGKPVSVTITVDATDPDGSDDIVRTTYSVTDEYGTYNVAETDLPEDGVISLIAVRDGKDKDGRVYTITVIVYDAGGLSDSGSVDVVVPHDQGNRL